MHIASLISKRKDEFVKICETHKVKSLFAFGSSINKNFNPQKSDIDLLVDVDVTDPFEKGEILISLWDSLEEFFNRKVDLISSGTLKNPYLINSIENTKTLIYERSGQKILG